VVETDVHHPTDSTLLGDGVRVEHCAMTCNRSAAPGAIKTGSMEARVFVHRRAGQVARPIAYQ
jgi:hypothetical protein